MRHAVHNLGPIFGRVMPERGQRVAFDTTVNEKRPAALQFGKACPERGRRIDVFPSRIRRRHLRRNGRNIVRRFAAGQLRGNNQRQSQN